jgi:ribose/xylose/arabinose/galactoside ABC-type transport system permease subunit
MSIVATIPSRENLARLLKTLIMPLSLLVLVGIATALQPSFLAANNIKDILTQAAPLGMVVLGQTLVILVRGLDLSVGSLMATVAVLATAFNATSDVAIPGIFIVVILFSALVGLLNGLLVTKRNVSPFLATLAMMIVLQGIRFAYTQGAPAGSLPNGFRWLGTGSLFGLPVNLLAFLVLFSSLVFLLHKTVFGRKIYMTGGNPRAADLVGVSSSTITITCYVLCSVLSGLGGLFLVGFVGTVDNWVGRGYELDSIVAAVIGGVALSGGSGTLAGATLGALVLIVLFNITIILGFPIQVQLVIKGFIIIFAAAMFARGNRRLT